MMTDSISIYWPSLITLHCSSGKPGYIMCPETMVMAASCLCVLRRISHLHFLMKIFYQRFKMWQQQWQKSQICTQKNKPLKSDVHGKREQSQCKGADGGGGGGGSDRQLLMGGEEWELREMRWPIGYQNQADCSAMGAEIWEEAKNSAHRSTAAGITRASHNSRLPWRQKWLNAHGHKQAV